jgi:hypothetical protein
MTDLLNGTGAHLGPEAVLNSLTAEQAFAKPHRLPHSVAHMCFWQEWFNGCVRSGFTGLPLHAAEGWPEGLPPDWESVRD